MKIQIQRFIEQNEIDLFHILSPFESFNQLPSHREMMNREYFGSIRLAVTLYDVIPLLFAKEYLRHPDVNAQYMQILNFIRSCDIIFAISEATKQDAVRAAGIPAEKIHVIMAGIDPRFKPDRTTRAKASLQRFGIHKPYVMCTGGMDFRKNTERLLEGFALANAQLQSGYHLVLCCNVTDADREHLTSLSHQLGIGSDLILTGYVPDEDLLSLYQGADLFVFPSLYEGFGLPVAEAMACGVPVVTSNNSSLAEIAGEAAVLVNPYQSHDIARGITSILLDSHLQSKLVHSGIKQAESFRWEYVGRKAIAGYERIYRKKIAIFSPLPPVKSGISDYQIRILPALAEKYECDFFIDDGYTPDVDTTIQGIQSYRHYQFPAKANGYDAVIYQMGNSGYHLYMVPYLHKYPGIVILHDLNLHGMTISWTLALNDKETYYQVMKANLGPKAREIVTRVIDGSIQRPHEHIILNKYYLASAHAVLVHNRYGQSQLSDLKSVSLARLPINLPEADADRTFTSSKSHFIFASFGYLPPHKHIDAVIRALGMMIEQGVKDAHYFVVGQVDAEYKAELETIIRQLKLKPYVHFTGRLEADQYERYLQLADVAINLRYPTYGESSASLLDTLAHGVPTIVSDIGSFSEFPDQVVRKIPPDPSKGTALFEAMNSLYRNDDLLAEMSQQAKAYIQANHSIEAYVNKLSSIIDALPNRRSNPGHSTILWDKNDRYYQEKTPDPTETPEPAPVQHQAEPAPLPVHQAESAPDAAADMAEAAVSSEAGNPRSLELHPARLRTRKGRRRGATYAAFQLGDLSPQAVQQAILHIPVSRKKGTLQINRIRRRWRRTGRPISYRHPVFSRKVSGPLLVEYDCTAIVQYWLQHPERNHGLRFTGITRPVLKIQLH
ncbi:glycosyltransferase [Paenibacillus senegalensis]|uniref:glycosyltransferase n=1 Tax=Paenibacillus senegalensis TaxID=1465766 RepID=UPI000288D071|nr:glycosyltransferase [Paenibacillus senegalensis]